jgi:hypothetical protein
MDLALLERTTISLALLLFCSFIIFPGEPRTPAKWPSIGLTGMYTVATNEHRVGALAHRWGWPGAFMDRKLSTVVNCSLAARRLQSDKESTFMCSAAPMGLRH